MQCPETPQLNISQESASTFCTTLDTDTPRRRTTTADLSRSPSAGRGLRNETRTPCDKVPRDVAGRNRQSNPNSHATTNFSRRLIRQPQSDDVFHSRNRSSAAASQFHEAARRLALSPMSHSAQNQSPSERGQPERSRKSYDGLSAKDTSLGKYNSQHKHHSDSQALFGRDITSARKNSPYRRSFPVRSPGAPVVPSLAFDHDSPIHSNPRRGRGTIRRIASKHHNFSRPTRPLDSSPAKSQARNFSRPVRSSQPATNWISESFTPKSLDRAGETSIPLSPLQEVDRHDYASLQMLPTQTRIVCTPEAAKSFTSLQTDIISNAVPVQSQNQSSETGSVHVSTRESFESAVSECMGDKRRQLSNWEIWLQRIFFSLFVFTANIALGLAYLGAFKHPYMLAILAFMKCKDILSTAANIVGILHVFLRELIWPPRQPDSRWILCLVCAYAETEEQILKTVSSLARGSTNPHKQAICIILDGKPRDILGKMSSVKITVQRPYTTWRGNRGEITVYAGYLEGTPLVLVEKAKNAGKKDSLILGHDLFNFPRKDMPHSTQMLRKEVWQTVLPTIIMTSRGSLEKFDFIFCTDADSTIHDQAIRKLADALCREDNAMAACGVLFAEFGGGWTEYAPWHLYQQFQYTFGQYVRRSAESVWGRVTCLPGCITMIVVRPEMGLAVSQYARPVTEHNLFRHQVQYLGTDRRLTWCMMSQGKHLRTIFVPAAISETVVPNSVSHYLSQRRRWASNAYFNDYFYMLGPRQRLITRFFAAVDIVRLTLVYYRVFNTGYFLHGLLTNFYVLKIIPTLIVTKTPAFWYLLMVLLREPLLRKRFHKVFLGMCINQIISPILSVIVFTNVIFHIGSQAWGKTGASTQGPAAGTTTIPDPTTSTTPSQGWTPRRLATSVRMAIRGVTPKRHPKKDSPTNSAAGKLGNVSKRTGHETPRAVHDNPLASNPLGSNDSITLPTSIASGNDTAERASSGLPKSTDTPAKRIQHDPSSTPSTLTWRTPYHRRRAQSKLGLVKETPVRMTDDSTTALPFED